MANGNKLHQRKSETYIHLPEFHRSTPFKSSRASQPGRNLPSMIKTSSENNAQYKPKRYHHENIIKPKHKQKHDREKSRVVEVFQTYKDVTYHSVVQIPKLVESTSINTTPKELKEGYDANQNHPHHQHQHHQKDKHNGKKFKFGIKHVPYLTSPPPPYHNYPSLPQSHTPTPMPYTHSPTPSESANTNSDSLMNSTNDDNHYNQNLSKNTKHIHHHKFVPNQIPFIQEEMSTHSINSVSSYPSILALKLSFTNQASNDAISILSPAKANNLSMIDHPNHPNHKHIISTNDESKQQQSGEDDDNINDAVSSDSSFYNNDESQHLNHSTNDTEDDSDDILNRKLTASHSYRLHHQHQHQHPHKHHHHSLGNLKSSNIIKKIPKHFDKTKLSTKHNSGDSTNSNRLALKLTPKDSRNIHISPKGLHNNNRLISATDNTVSSLLDHEDAYDPPQPSLHFSNVSTPTAIPTNYNSSSLTQSKSNTLHHHHLPHHHQHPLPLPHHHHHHQHHPHPILQCNDGDITTIKDGDITTVPATSNSSSSSSSSASSEATATSTDSTNNEKNTTTIKARKVPRNSQYAPYATMLQSVVEEVSDQSSLRSDHIQNQKQNQNAPHHDGPNPIPKSMLLPQTNTTLVGQPSDASVEFHSYKRRQEEFNKIINNNRQQIKRNAKSMNLSHNLSPHNIDNDSNKNKNKKKKTGFYNNNNNGNNGVYKKRPSSSVIITTNKANRKTAANAKQRKHTVDIRRPQTSRIRVLNHQKKQHHKFRNNRHHHTLKPSKLSKVTRKARHHSYNPQDDQQLFRYELISESLQSGDAPHRHARYASTTTASSFTKTATATATETKSETSILDDTGTTNSDDVIKIAMTKSSSIDSRSMLNRYNNTNNINNNNYAYYRPNRHRFHRQQSANHNNNRLRRPRNVTIIRKKYTDASTNGTESGTGGTGGINNMIRATSAALYSSPSLGAHKKYGLFDDENESSAKLDINMHKKKSPHIVKYRHQHKPTDLSEWELSERDRFFLQSKYKSFDESDISLHPDHHQQSINIDDRLYSNDNINHIICKKEIHDAYERGFLAGYFLGVNIMQQQQKEKDTNVVPLVQ